MTVKKVKGKVKGKGKKMPTPAEKQAVVDASLPPKGVKVKVKTKWSRDAVCKIIDQLQGAKSIISLYSLKTAKVKADSRSWRDNYNLARVPGATVALDQLITNLYDARKEMSEW